MRNIKIYRKIIVISIIGTLIATTFTGCKLAIDKSGDNKKEVNEGVVQDAEAVGVFITEKPIKESGKIYAAEVMDDSKDVNHIFEEYEGYGIYTHYDWEHGCIGTDSERDDKFYDFKLNSKVNQIDDKENISEEVEFVCNLDVKEMQNRGLDTVYVNPVFQDNDGNVFMIVENKSIAVHPESIGAEVSVEYKASTEKLMESEKKPLDTKARVTLVTKSAANRLIAREYNDSDEIIATTEFDVNNIKDEYKANKNTDYIIISFMDGDKEVDAKLVEGVVYDDEDDEEADGKEHFWQECYVSKDNELFLQIVEIEFVK
ncbi:MAG: hypothetical protein E7254_07765 [Lachnospiraceae bacterium]|nr:hypothetical protein [Lachnospiraceae bacterium]